MLVRYQNIDAILGAEADDDRENARALAAVQRDADTVRLSRSLVSLRTDANVGVNLQACRIKSMQ